MNNKMIGIYDFETLSKDRIDGVVVSCAWLLIEEDELLPNTKMSFKNLIDRAETVKLDTREQIERFKMHVCPDTVAWWGRQNDKAKEQLKPSPHDISLSEFPGRFRSYLERMKGANGKISRMYSRNNTFDPIFMGSIHKRFDAKLPYDEFSIRDTKSTIDGLSWGNDLRDNFIPDNLDTEFIYHDPKHDICIDIMRLHALIQAQFADEPPWD